MKFAPTKRIHAIWVLMCWLWFSAAAPFAHQCASGVDRHLPGWSSAPVTCIACEWGATTAPVEVAEPPTITAQLTLAQEWAAPAFIAPTVFCHFLASRGPPTLA